MTSLRDVGISRPTLRPLFCKINTNAAAHSIVAECVSIPED
jgi:hypothetical protein